MVGDIYFATTKGGLVTNRDVAKMAFVVNGDYVDEDNLDEVREYTKRCKGITKEVNEKRSNESYESNGDTDRYNYIISYDGAQLRDSGDFGWGLYDSYEEAEEAANDAKEEYMNAWDIEGSEYDPNDFYIEIVEVW